MNIKPPSPLAVAYQAHKTQNIHNNSSSAFRAMLDSSSAASDDVSLSSPQAYSQTPVKRIPSSPVTTEEQQALYSAFSIQA